MGIASERGSRPRCLFGPAFHALGCRQLLVWPILQETTPGIYPACKSPSASRLESISFPPSCRKSSPMSKRSSLAIWTLMLVFQPLVTHCRSDEPAEGRALSFEMEIRSILRAHCFDCHGATGEIEGELDLRLVRFMIRGGQSGPAIAPGNAQGSFVPDRGRNPGVSPGSQRLRMKRVLSG